MTRSKLLLLTALIFSTGFALFFAYYRQEQRSDPSYALTTLGFTNTGKELISKDFYEEVLDLSVEHPVNLVQISLRQAEKKLLAYPFIEAVTLEKMLPDTLFVDCALRKPLLELADYDRIAIDLEGYIFPIHFFYTPKRLPKVYLGLGISQPLKFDTHSLKLDPQELELILALLEKLPDLKMIDLSQLNAETLGRQEIILTLPGNRYVRLPTRNWEEALANLPKIPSSYQEVDLRYTKLALVR